MKGRSFIVPFKGWKKPEGLDSGQAFYSELIENSILTEMILMGDRTFTAKILVSNLNRKYADNLLNFTNYKTIHYRTAKGILKEGKMKESRGHRIFWKKEENHRLSQGELNFFKQIQKERRKILLKKGYSGKLQKVTGVRLVQKHQGIDERTVRKHLKGLSKKNIVEIIPVSRPKNSFGGLPNIYKFKNPPFIMNAYDYQRIRKSDREELKKVYKEIILFRDLTDTKGEREIQIIARYK